MLGNSSSPFSDILRVILLYEKKDEPILNNYGIDTPPFFASGDTTINFDRVYQGTQKRKESLR